MLDDESINHPVHNHEIEKLKKTIEGNDDGNKNGIRCS